MRESASIVLVLFSTHAHVSLALFRGPPPSATEPCRSGRSAPRGELPHQASLIGAKATDAAAAAFLEHNLATHRREIESGRKRFPTIHPDEHVTDCPRSAEHNEICSVGVGNAGPEEGLLRCGHLIHATAEPVLSVAECDTLIAEARAAILSGQTSTFTYTASSKIGEVHVHELPHARSWLRGRLHDTLFPWAAERFGDPTDDSNVVVAQELAVYDALVIAYNASEGGGTRQPMHRDASLLSLNVALSPPSSFEGGGTYFETVGGAPLQLAQGHAMCHASGARHAGFAISSGERWVLVVFLIAERAPMHASRCYAQAVELRRAGQTTGALTAFATAVRASPRDHEMRHGLASALAMSGELPAARASLAAAIHLYPACPKPRNALGSMLVAAGRTRAALRHFEAALARSLEPDDDDAWEASVNIALCLVTLAELEAETEAERPPRVDGVATRRWRHRMPEARQHLQLAIAAEGQASNERLLDLLSRSTSLMHLQAELEASS